LLLQAILQGEGLVTGGGQVEERQDGRGAKVNLLEDLGTRVGEENVFHPEDHVDDIEVEFASLELCLIVKINDSK